MSWDKEVAEIEVRRNLSKLQGGDEGVALQHAKGRLTIRERIKYLVGDSFEEHGEGAGFAEKDSEGHITGFQPANYVIGLGQVKGRRVAIGGEDFTVKGGSPNGAGLRKSVYAEELAVQFRVPLIRLLEGGGGSVAGSSGNQGSVTAGTPVYAQPRFSVIARAMHEVPVVSGAMGPVAGFPAGRLVASHFSVMVKERSQVMVAGPALVERALGKSLTKEELGGWKIHTRSGVVDNVADTEEEALLQLEKFLEYMPQNVWELPVRLACKDDPGRADEELLSIVPRDRRQSFKMREVVERVVDKQSWFEIAPYYGKGQVVGLARLNGAVVGIIANDCRHFAGAMTAEGSQKVKRMIELCDTFHIPVVNFMDEPGFMLGPQAESSATIRYGMSAVAAAVQSTVPWANIAVRKSYGVATAAHFAANTYKLAWPSWEMGALPVEGGVAVAFHREIESADDPAEKRKELEDMLAANKSPFPMMEGFAVHELIDPRQTRNRLCRWIEWIEPLLPELKGQVRWGIRP